MQNMGFPAGNAAGPAAGAAGRAWETNRFATTMEQEFSGGFPNMVYDIFVGMVAHISIHFIFH